MDSDRYSNANGSLSVLADNPTPIPKYRRLGGANFNRQPNAFGVEEQNRESLSEIAAQAPISSVVKWFNPKRGFGFVELSDGFGDAFLHRNVLAKRDGRCATRCPSQSTCCSGRQGATGRPGTECRYQHRCTCDTTSPKNEVEWAMRGGRHGEVVQSEQGFRIHRSRRRW